MGSGRYHKIRWNLKFSRQPDKFRQGCAASEGLGLDGFCRTTLLQEPGRKPGGSLMQYRSQKLTGLILVIFVEHFLITL